MPMFKKVKRKSANPSPTAQLEHVSVKYPKPKILLLDLPEEAATALTASGFNVSTGSLGRPYRVAKDSGYQPLIGRATVPNHTEQEIVVIDFGFGELEAGARGEKHRPYGEPDLWGKCDRGFLDPRVRSANELQKPFDRILSAGGVFVIFADGKTGIDVQVARGRSSNELLNPASFRADVWDILSELSDMNVRSDHGTEMQAVQSESPLVRLLAQHLKGGEFTCTLRGGYRSEGGWKTLAVNKIWRRSRRRSLRRKARVSDRSSRHQ
jgi:hypothetical protein